MDLTTLTQLWKKYENMNYYVYNYNKQELQELSDAARIIPAQAKYLGLNALDDNTYKERYALFVAHSLKMN